MSDFNYTGYNQRKRAALSSYGAKTAQNAYSRFLSQQRGARRKFGLQEQQQRETPRVVGGFTRRGLAGPGVQSGIYQKGLQDLAKRYTQEMSDLDFELGAEQGQFDLNERQYLAELQDEERAAEEEKRRQIAEAASTLTAFRPFLGV